MKAIRLNSRLQTGTSNKTPIRLHCFIFQFALMVLLLALVSPAGAQSAGNIVVNISGFPSSDGFAMVALHNSEDSYQGGEDSAISKTKALVKDRKAQVIFTNLPYGWYGVSLYHDENGNGIADVTVGLYLDGSGNSYTKTYSNGYYRFSDLPAGNYALWAEPPEDFNPEGTMVAVVDGNVNNVNFTRK